MVRPPRMSATRPRTVDELCTRWGVNVMGRKAENPGNSLATRVYERVYGVPRKPPGGMPQAGERRGVAGGPDSASWPSRRVTTRSAASTVSIHWVPQDRHVPVDRVALSMTRWRD